MFAARVEECFRELHTGYLLRDYPPVGCGMEGAALPTPDIGFEQEHSAHGPMCLQFRVEAFNLFNTPQFDQPGSAISETAGLAV